MVRGLLTYNMLPNLLATHPPMQMDGNFGITAGICEILVQSHAGQIAILPALPAAWSNGSFSGLRARGGFEVGASWKAGKPVEATLTSLLGKPVVLQTPIPIRAVTSNGKPVGIQTVGNTVRFQTQAGRKYLLAF
jgi:alpha-L-fucosidase 2